MNVRNTNVTAIFERKRNLETLIQINPKMKWHDPVAPPRMPTKVNTLSKPQRFYV